MAATQNRPGGQPDERSALAGLNPRRYLRRGADPASGQVGAPHTPAERAIQILALAVLIFVALLMFVPFLYSVATSFKTIPEAAQLSIGNMFWPDEGTTAAYQTAFDSNIARWFFNSVFVALCWIVGRAIMDTMAGYAFARMQFPGRDILFIFVLGTMMVPGIVTVVPKFILLRDLGLLDTYGALTIPFLADAFGIFLMKQFFESIPRDLEEAARIDGANRYQIFRQIVLPNAIPAVAALAIFSFQGSWNAFLEPVLFTAGAGTDLYTLPVGLANFRAQFNTNWPVLMAIAVITTVPMAIFFLVFQRYFIASNVSSGIKG
ncbi:MAG: carbohydrate ABC transporter permease [Chloroflexota bacterium]|nr:carbohydrate ABC transporter permease [Chloroflexota bacterium]